MSITVTPPEPCHRDDPTCWCHPQIVQTGQIGSMAIAKLVHGDLLGWYLGTFAAARVWDSRWMETA